VNFADENSLMLLLAVLPFMIIPFFKIWKSKKEAMKYFSEKSFRQFFRGYSFPKTNLKALMLCIGLFCTVFSMAQPYVGSTLISVSTRQSDVMIALDVSPSMNTQDLYPDRFQVQMKEIASVLEQPDTRVSLIPFSSEALLLSPFTEDREVLRMFLKSIKPGFIKNTGTDYEVLFKRIVDEYDNMENIRKSNGVEIIPTRLILVFTDGESQAYPSQETLNEMKERDIEVWIEVIATEVGGKVPLYDETGKFKGYYGDEHISKPNIDELRKIVFNTGGRLFIYDENTRMSQEYKEFIQKNQEAGTVSNTYEIRNDISYIFLLIAIIALFISVVL